MSQQINLYAARLRPSTELLTGRNVGLAAVVLLVLMSAVAALAQFDARRKSEAAALMQKQVGAAQEHLVELNKAMAERRVSPALAAELDNAKALLGTRQEVMQVLDSGRLGNSSGFSGLMTGFAKVSLNDIWLTGFRINQGGEEIEIRGRMLDQSRLPGYVQRLSNEPVFQGRRFAALEMNSVEPQPTKNEMSATPSVDEKKTSPLPRFVEFILRSENIGEAPKPGITANAGGGQ